MISKFIESFIFPENLVIPSNAITKKKKFLMPLLEVQGLRPVPPEPYGIAQDRLVEGRVQVIVKGAGTIFDHLIIRKGIKK